MTTSSTSYAVLKRFEAPKAHARPPLLPSEQAEGTLHDEAVLADRGATVRMSLALLWRELSLGLCRIVDTFFTEQRCFLVTRPTSAGTPIEGRRLQILEAVLAGIGQKRLAIELNLAPSTVALNARLALTSLGVQSRPSRVHPLLMLAARAGRNKDPQITAALSFLSREEAQLRVFSAPRPELQLSRALPPAELAVIRSLIEGASYEEIALGRGTSTRTIANQITAVFRRMKVSGRSELMLRLFSEHGGP